MNFAMLLLLGISLLSCNKTSGDVVIPPDENPVDSSAIIPGWTMIWNDEFNGAGVDTTKWEYEVNGNGGGNNELQYYTDKKENSFIENGALIIQARQENYLGKEYTSARLRTKYKGDWTYGLFVIRAKLPYGKGLWPAIWMLPTDWEYGGWPQSGEIDIMELLGDNARKVYGTIHYAGTSNDHQQSGGSFTLPSGNFVEEYHTFIVAWDSTGFQWFVDDSLYFNTAKAKPFDKRFHLLLNVAVGGNWPGSPDAFTTFPQRMTVDYVRVYKKTE